MGVVFAAWQGPVPAALRGVTFSVTENTRYFAFPSDCSVLVLGSAALGPDAVCSCNLEHFGGTVLVLTDRRRRPARPDDLGRFVRRAQLARQALRACAALPLQRVPFAAWADAHHVRVSEEDRVSLRLLPRLSRFESTEWARVARQTRRELEALSRRAMGVPPGELLRSYRLATARWLQSHGHALRAIAAVADYSSKQSISKALRQPRGKRTRRNDDA